MGKGDKDEVAEKSDWLFTPTKVDLWNNRALKLAIDDHVGAILEKEKSFRLNNWNTDFRIVLEALISVTGIGAFLHGLKYPFPASRDTLMIALASYFFLFAVHFVRMYYQGDAIVYGTVNNSDYIISTKCPNVKAFTITLAVVDRKTNETREYTTSRPIESYFHEDGYLAQNVVHKDVKALLKKGKGQ